MRGVTWQDYERDLGSGSHWSARRVLRAHEIESF